MCGRSGALFSRRALEYTGRVVRHWGSGVFPHRGRHRGRWPKCLPLTRAGDIFPARAREPSPGEGSRGSPVSTIPETGSVSHRKRSARVVGWWKMSSRARRRHRPAAVDTVRKLDEISDVLCQTIDAAEFCRHVHHDEAWRRAAHAACGQLGGLSVHELNTHYGLYTALCRRLEGVSGGASDGPDGP